MPMSGAQWNRRYLWETDEKNGFRKVVDCTRSSRCRDHTYMNMWERKDLVFYDAHVQTFLHRNYRTRSGGTEYINNAMRNYYNNSHIARVRFYRADNKESVLTISFRTGIVWRIVEKRLLELKEEHDTKIKYQNISVRGPNSDSPWYNSAWVNNLHTRGRMVNLGWKYIRSVG